MTLSAPFPYYGGKSRVASDVWEKFGNPDVYVEPFAGSLAVLLARPGGAGQREVICDLDGHICNFWRAVSADPERVAHHADWPTFHQDLTARHKWLVDWGRNHAARLSEDPDWHDAKAAGWWVWGKSSWVGSGWCQDPVRDFSNKRPAIGTTGGGKGVQKQRRDLHEKRPFVHNTSGGRGVSKQRAHDQRPFVANTGYGNGVQKQRRSGSDIDKIMNWFSELSKRLEKVVVLNRDWKSAVTPVILQDCASQRDDPTTRAIFLDPPYLTAERSKTLYVSDKDKTSDSLALESWRWAVEHGDRYRIAYCAHVGDFEIPAGWDSISQTFGAIVRKEKMDRKDLIVFSPACLGRSQGEFSL